jgi:hypothetical protein
LLQSYKQASFIGFSGTGNIEGGTVINGGTDHGETDSDVNSSLNAKDLHRAVALIVVHGDNDVEVSPAGAEKKCVGW